MSRGREVAQKIEEDLLKIEGVFVAILGEIANEKSDGDFSVPAERLFGAVRAAADHTNLVSWHARAVVKDNE